jgi:phosphoadenosine phosphosulfate reductase
MTLTEYQQIELPGMNKLKEITEIAIERIRAFEPSEGYYLAFSGGKDSEVVYDLTVKSGVKFDAHFSVTTVDPPEVLKFIRENYPSVEWHYPEKNMFQLVFEKGLPRRNARFCCEALKEGGGDGRFLVTGIRAAESVKRANLSMVELCRKGLGKKFLHPIIDWSAAEVWLYIRANKMAYCSLYDQGFKRLGCVLCPMSSEKQAQSELKRFPKLARAWRIAADKFFTRQTPSTVEHWATSEEMWQWWLSRKGQKKDNGQCSLFI